MRCSECLHKGVCSKLAEYEGEEWNNCPDFLDTTQLLVFPTRIGGTIYFINRNTLAKNFGDYYVDYAKFEGVWTEYLCRTIERKKPLCLKQVWATRQEAEAYVKELERKNANNT